MKTRIACIVTLGFNADEEAPVECALDAILRLAPYFVVLVHDCKGRSGQCARTAAASRAAVYQAAGVKLEVYPVDQGEASLRWRAGVVEKAFADPLVDATFVFASDFDKHPADTIHEGWNRMAESAGSDALVLGEYQPKPGSFEDLFHQLVAKPAVEATYPEAKELPATGVQRLGCEFFILGRAVFEKYRSDAVLWNMDPAAGLVLACLRSEHLHLRVVCLGLFADAAAPHDPLCEMFQILRYVFQLLLNLVRIRRKGLDRFSQIQAYEELLPVVDRAIEICQYAARRNLEQLKRNPKVAAVLPGSPFRPRWVPAPFHGFSYLFYAGDCLAKSAEGYSHLNCDLNAPGFAFYAKLARAIDRLSPEVPAFCPLDPRTFHATYWDGICLANAGDLTFSARAEYAAYANALPGSVATGWSILPPPVVNLGHPWSVRFRFKALQIRVPAAALVALLEPVDEESKASLEAIEQHRRDLDTSFAAFGRRPNPAPFAPHVSCGYFETIDDAAAAQEHLAEWTQSTAVEVGTETIRFSEARLFSFTTMEHFWSHSD